MEKSTFTLLDGQLEKLDRLSLEHFGRENRSGYLQYLINKVYDERIS